MSIPREVIPGRAYMITRHCKQPQFITRPERETNNASIYWLFKVPLLSSARPTLRPPPVDSASIPTRMSSEVRAPPTRKSLLIQHAVDAVLRRLHINFGAFLRGTWQPAALRPLPGFVCLLLGV